MSLNKLLTALERQFPYAVITVDPPLDPTGAHHVDIRWAKRFIVVDWTPTVNGYGISLMDEATCALDGGPDVRVATIEEVTRRVGDLLA